MNRGFKALGPTATGATAERLITVSMAAMTAFCLLRQRNLEPQPNKSGQCAAEAERHCDHGRLHYSLCDFAPPSQMSEIPLRLDRLGRIDAKTNQRFLRRLFPDTRATCSTSFLSISLPPIALAAAE